MCSRRSSLFTPDTIHRRHRELVAQKWNYSAQRAKNRTDQSLASWCILLAVAATMAAAVDLLMTDLQTEQTSSSSSSTDLAELATMYLYAD